MAVFLGTTQRGYSIKAITNVLFKCVGYKGISFTKKFSDVHSVKPRWMAGYHVKQLHSLRAMEVSETQSN